MQKLSLLVLTLSIVFTPAEAHAQLRLTRRDDLGWHHHAIYHVRFSGDGKSLVSAGADSTVRIWDLMTGKVRTVLESGSVQVGSRLEVSPNLQTIIHRAYLHTEKKREDAMIIWDVAKRTREIDTRHAVVGFDLDNQAHLVGRNLSGGFSVIVRGVPGAGKKVGGSKAKVLAAALHPRGQMLAVASADNSINIWDLTTRRSAAKFDGYDASAKVRLGFSRDGNKLYANSGDALKLWRLEKGQWQNDGKEIQLGKKLSFCAISPDGASMIGANWSAEESLICWSLPDFKVRWSSREKEVICADFSPDGKTVVTGTQESLIKLWDAETGKPLRTLQGSAPLGDRAVFIDGGKTLLTAASEQVKSDTSAWIRLVNLADGKTTSLPRTKPAIRIAGTRDGKTLAAAYQSGAIDLLERATGKVLRTIDAHKLSKTNYTVTSLHFSPDGLTLASSGMDGTVGLWEVATGKNLATLTGHESPVADMTFSHDGKTLASSGTGTLILWDVHERKRKQTLNGPFKRGPNAIAFSRDDRTVATGDGEGNLILWDVESGKIRREWKGHPHVVWGLSFTPDDKILASSGNDKEVRMWDTATGKELAAFNCRYEQCLSVAFSPDGRTLVTSGNSRGVIVWDVERGK